MSSIFLKNGRLIDPERNLSMTADLSIVDGKIAAMGANLDPKGAEVIDCSGLIVAPGFIDPFVRLGEPGEEYKEDILSGSAAAAAGGFTSIAVVPDTKLVNDNRALTESIKRKAAMDAFVNVLPLGAVSVGCEGKKLAEIYDMFEGGIVAVTDGSHPITDTQLLRRALEYTTLFDLAVFQHPEDPSLTNRGCITEGPMAARLGLLAAPVQAETLTVWRDVRMAAWLGGRLHFSRVSAAESVEAIAWARTQGARVTGAVTPQHLSFIDEDLSTFDANLKLNPPLRRERDRKALIDGIKAGTLSVLTSGHEPQSELEKDREFEDADDGAISLEAAVSVYVDVLHHQAHVPVERILPLLTLEPARLLNLPTKGRLAEGMDGDITIIDPDRPVAFTREHLHSKSANCPYLGRRYRGAPVMTIVGGRLVAREHRIVAVGA